MTKACSVCKIEVARGEYSPDRRAKDGLQSCCKACSRERRHRKYQADPEAGAARQRDYNARNPERLKATQARSRAKNQEKIKALKKVQYERAKSDPEWQERQRLAREANKEAKRDYDRNYRAANAEKMNVRRKKWAENNPERQAIIRRTYKHRRRAKVAEGDPIEVLREWELGARKVCYWCGAKCRSIYHVDHYVPLARGGRHEVANLVIACPPCNLRKSARDPYEFAVTVGRLL